MTVATRLRSPLTVLDIHFAYLQVFCHLRTSIEYAVTLQVVYPALDLKVKNVTHAYSVEHEDEVSYCSAVPGPSPGLYQSEVYVYTMIHAGFGQAA